MLVSCHICGKILGPKDVVETEIGKLCPDCYQEAFRCPTDEAPKPTAWREELKHRIWPAIERLKARRSTSQYRKYLVDTYTNQLVSHGAMLFASLIASITYLVHVDSPAMTLLGARGIVSWLILGSLLGFTTYVLSRIFWYGNLLGTANDSIPIPGDLLHDYGFGRWELQSQDSLWDYSQLVIMKARCRCGDVQSREIDPNDLTWEKCKKLGVDKGLRRVIYWLLIQPSSALRRFATHTVIGLVLSWGLMATLL